MPSLSLTAEGSTFWEPFWPALVATLIGAFVGFLLALRVDRARERRMREAEEAALLGAARDAVEANLTLCAQLKVRLPQALHVPTFEMDVGLLDVILPRLAELSLEAGLLQELNNFRYQLHHVNRKLDHMLALTRLPLTNLATELAEIAGSITGTIAALEGSGQQILPPMLDGRLKALEPPWLPWWGFWGG